MTVKILTNNFTKRMNTIADLGEVNCPTFKAVPLHWEHDGKMLTSPLKNGTSLHRGIINEETGQLLSTVKPSYCLHQYSETFASLESLLVQSDLDLNGISREVGFSHGGGRMKVVYNLPSHQIDLGNGDVSNMQICADDSVDGCWSLNQFVGAVRMLCLNSQVSISHLTNYRAKHTQALDLEIAKEITAKCINEFTVQGEMWKKWKSNTVTDREAFGIFWKAAKESPLAKDAELRETLDSKAFLGTPSLVYLWKQWQEEKQLLGSNHWAVFNALTHWSTHAPARNESEATNIVDVKKRREDKIKKSFLKLAA